MVYIQQVGFFSPNLISCTSEGIMKWNQHFNTLSPLVLVQTYIIRDDLKRDPDPTKITAPIWETADGGHSYLCFAG